MKAQVSLQHLHQNACATSKHDNAQENLWNEEQGLT